MLTKILSAIRTPKVHDRPTAWACLSTNLLIFPGLGSLMAGRKEGWAQCILAGITFILFNLWLVLFSIECFRLEKILWDGGSYILYGILGLVGLLISWVWSLITSIQILRSIPKDSIEPPIISK